MQCVCVRACVRACVCERMHVCVRVCACSYKVGHIVVLWYTGNLIHPYPERNISSIKLS